MGRHSTGMVWPSPSAEALEAFARGAGRRVTGPRHRSEVSEPDVARVPATSHRGRAVVVPEMGRFVSPQYRRAGVQS